MIPRRCRQVAWPDTSALPFDGASAWKEDWRDGRPRQRLEVLGSAAFDDQKPYE